MKGVHRRHGDSRRTVGAVGDAVYYFTRVDQTVSLYKISLDPEGQAAGGEPDPLVTGLETDEGFGISADGKRLVYARGAVLLQPLAGGHG